MGLPKVPRSGNFTGYEVIRIPDRSNDQFTYDLMKAHVGLRATLSDVVNEWNRVYYYEILRQFNWNPYRLRNNLGQYVKVFDPDVRIGPNAVVINTRSVIWSNGHSSPRLNGALSLAYSGVSPVLRRAVQLGFQGAQQSPGVKAINDFTADGSFKPQASTLSKFQVALPFFQTLAAFIPSPRVRKVVSIGLRILSVVFAIFTAGISSIVQFVVFVLKSFVLPFILSKLERAFFSLIPKKYVGTVALLYGILRGSVQGRPLKQQLRLLPRRLFNMAISHFRARAMRYLKQIAPQLYRVYGGYRRAKTLWVRGQVFRSF